MINLMIVAGGNSGNLATFLQQRGTFNVEFVYNDLHSNVDELSGQIVRVDKLVYLYQVDSEGNSNTNIRADMQTLRELLKNNGFFKPTEIIFLCGEGEQYSQARKYFNTIMSDCKVKLYDTRVLDKSGSFSSVYDNLIGTTLTKDFKNVYRPLYRVERGSNAIKSYTSVNDEDLVIKPVTNDNVKKWEEQKKIASSIEQATPIEDADDSERHKWISPELGSIKTDDVLQDGRLILVTGQKHSGKSVWATAMSQSACKVDRKVCIIDFTESADVSVLQANCSTKFTEYQPLDLLRLHEYEGPIQCTVPRKIIEEYLMQVVLKRFSVFDTIFVVTEFDDCSRAISMLSGILTDVLFTSFATQHEVMQAKRVLDSISAKKTIALAKEDVILQGESRLAPEGCKELIPDAIVIKPYSFKKCDNTDWLFQRIILGGVK